MTVSSGSKVEERGASKAVRVRKTLPQDSHPLPIIGQERTSQRAKRYCVHQDFYLTIEDM